MVGFKDELVNNILPFWIENMPDKTHGGFFGRIGGDGILYEKANKGAVLNARILWTFSAAYRILKKPEYLDMATRAFEYINRYFIDKKNGGIYWELDYKGNPVNTKKQTYAQGFALYGFSEFYRATGNSEALAQSKEFFYLLEKCYDDKLGGYLEAYTEDWQPIDDMRLSDKDANEKKTMNTHLHILEPYTNLCRIWNNEDLKKAQYRLINIFTDKILNVSGNHLNLFFDENWTVKSPAISYGHDIEASWLLFEAAEITGNKELLLKIKDISLNIADAAAEGLQSDGSLIYEYKNGHRDNERHWWVQAEGIVGYMYAFKNSSKREYLDNAEALWNYIKQNIIDRDNGEWIWSRLPDGSINTKDDKAGFWKCPYHNSRMCLEMIEHFGYE